MHSDLLHVYKCLSTAKVASPVVFFPDDIVPKCDAAGPSAGSMNQVPMVLRVYRRNAIYFFQQPRLGVGEGRFSTRDATKSPSAKNSSGLLDPCSHSAVLA